MLEVGKVYRGRFENAMMCAVLEVSLYNGRPNNYLLLWLTTSGNPDAGDVAGKTEWEVARDAENYLEELP